MDNNIKDVDQSAEWLLPTHTSGTSGIYGEPQKAPRVGDEYQAQIPTLITENDRLQLMELPMCQEPMIDGENHFDFGLSIPVMWISDQHENVNNHAMGTDANPDVAQLKMNGPVESENIKESANGKANLLGSPRSFECKEYSSLPVPDSLGESWSNTEHDSFLLGLYIFGKNLRLVTKFVGNKGLGSVLSYYYGEFYRSSEYNKWSPNRKKKTRRSIHGEKIFSGWRQQELLSRLSSNITEECKNRLTEATKIFGEGKLSFEEYIFTLKNMVGVNLLVEAVAIGKEKRDLTGMAMESLKMNNSFNARYEAPIRKACSTLTTEEIVNLLKGDVRLSKAKSSDLFWEAVWPRLLARGWHSEQPGNYVFQNSKHSLVFIVPGIAKFSRRRLEKGSHYFDSLTDVLNKVALEPELLELEPEQDRLEDPPAKQGSDDKQQFSLQPNVPQCNQGLMKFTIVDTSLACGEKGHVKVRELRSLPVGEPVNIPASPVISGETDQERTEESENEVEEEEEDTNHNTLMPDERDVTESIHHASDLPECETGTIKNDLANCLNPKISGVEDKKVEISTDGQSKRTLKIKFRRKTQPQQANDLGGLATEKYEIKRCDSYKESKPDDVASETCGSLKAPSGDDEDEAVQETCSKKKRQRTLIDLNLPQVDQDSDSDESLLSTKPSVLPETSNNQPEPSNPSNAAPVVEEQPPVINRPRQSTRNRPLTTKALEALANGFLSPKKKRKSGESKAPRRVRAKTALVSSCGVEDVEKGVDGVHGGSSHMVSDSPK